MALASQQVIATIVARLVAAATSSQARVHSGRFHPVATFPTTLVSHAGEEVGPADGGADITWPATLLHQLQVEVQVLVQASAELDAAMATAAQQVLQALLGQVAPLAPLPASLLPEARIDYAAATDGQANTGRATLRLAVQFQTQANDPETIV